jgi:hypothetical protein
MWHVCSKPDLDDFRIGNEDIGGDGVDSENGVNGQW